MLSYFNPHCKILDLHCRYVELYTENTANVRERLLDSEGYALSQLGMPHLKLKEQQQQAILAVYGGMDVFVFLPTGFGKSICYQVLPFLFDYKLGLVGSQKGMCAIVVSPSPLIALMVDQVKSLGNGVEAVVISSSSRDSSVFEKEFIATDKNLRTVSFIFSSPEALSHTKWREVLEKPPVSSRVCAVVIDEAHCVSKW